MEAGPREREAGRKARQVLADRAGKTTMRRAAKTPCTSAGPARPGIAAKPGRQRPRHCGTKTPCTRKPNRPAHSTNKTPCNRTAGRGAQHCDDDPTRPRQAGDGSTKTPRTREPNRPGRSTNKTSCTRTAGWRDDHPAARPKRAGAGTNRTPCTRTRPDQRDAPQPRQPRRPPLAASPGAFAPEADRPARMTQADHGQRPANPLPQTRREC